MRPFTLSLALGLSLAPLAVCVASPAPLIVTTDGAFNATYATVSQTSPIIPWSDIGFQTFASTTQGTLSSTVGGATQYQLTSSISGGQTLAPGDAINLGYTPGWTGSMTTQANGKLGINFAYNIGPFSGHVPVLTDNMNTGVSGLNLAGALNSGSPLSTDAITPGPGISATLGMNALVASASIHFNVGSQVTQNLAVTPTVIYGDLIWYTNDTTHVSTTPMTVLGGGGSLSNTFAPDPFALGLSTGSTFDMNILPFAQLSLGIGNESIVSVPASITYNYDVFGSSGSGSIASGNLYALSSGLSDLTASGTWYAPNAYSIELDATSCNFNSIGDICTYQTDGTTPLDLTTYGIGIASNVPLGSTPPGPPSGGGGSSDYPNFGPLIPGDTPCVPGVVCQAPCDPTTGLDCIRQVNLTGSVPEPETLWLLGGGLLVLGWARRRAAVRAASVAST
jgi:PEP-CTERM motif